MKRPKKKPKWKVSPGPTPASRADWAHINRRLAEEQRKPSPIEVRYACTCPRNCMVHPGQSAGP